MSYETPTIRVCATCQWGEIVPAGEDRAFHCPQCDEGRADPDGVKLGAWINEHVGRAVLSLRKREDGQWEPVRE